MAAPDSAYQTEKYRMRQGTAATFHRIAKYTGRHNSIANAKLNFHLDYVFAIRKSGSDYGFVGMVAESGSNAAWRSSSRLSAHRIRRGGTNYRLLLDAGLNIKGTAGSISVKYAFGNYWHITWPVFGAPYEGCTYRLIMSSTSGGTSQYSVNGSVGQAATKTDYLINRGGMVYWETARTVYLRAEVTNGEGTRTVSTSLRFLAPLNFGPFVPVNSYAETPQKNHPDVVTLLVDKTYEDGIYDIVDGLQMPSVPSVPIIAEGSDQVALLGEGDVSGEASDDLLENYYNAVKNGGTSYDKPANGYYVNTTGKLVGGTRVYYGVYITSGRITSIFRARIPTTVLPTITLTMNISDEPGYTNRYRITFSLSASTTPPEEVTVTISALQLRKTISGSPQTGQFQNLNGSVFDGRTISIGGDGFHVAANPAILITTLSKPFYVTATASCDNGNYRFVNSAAGTGNSSGGITPVDPVNPIDPVQVQP